MPTRCRRMSALALSKLRFNGQSATQRSGDGPPEKRVADCPFLHRLKNGHSTTLDRSNPRESSDVADCPYPGFGWDALARGTRSKGRLTSLARFAVDQATANSTDNLRRQPLRQKGRAGNAALPNTDNLRRGAWCAAGTDNLRLLCPVVVHTGRLERTICDYQAR